MHVPLVIDGPGVARRRERHAGQCPRASARSSTGRASRSEHGCAAGDEDIVLGEAMKPLSRVRLAAAGDGGGRPLQGDPRRAARGPTIWTADPQEAHDLGSGVALPPGAEGDGGLSGAVTGRRARAANLDEDARRQAREHWVTLAPRRAGGPQGRAAAGRDDAAVRNDGRGGCAVRCRPDSRRRSRCCRRCWPRIPQPRRGAAARDRRTRRSGRETQAEDALPAGRRDRAQLAGRADVPGASLRADEGLDARGAAARAGGEGESGPADGGGRAGAD